MTQYSCIECRTPIPAHPRRALPAHGYTVAKIVAEPCGVLLRDQFGLPATYYGRVIGSLVKNGCPRPACEHYHMRSADQQDAYLMRLAEHARRDGQRPSARIDI